MSFPQDPRWIVAKYPGKCFCGSAIAKGERCFYYPNTRTLKCVKCSEQAARDFEAAKQDEEFCR